MKKSIFFFILMLTTLTFPHSSLADTADFLGKWVNVDSNTRGVTNFIITGTTPGDTLKIQVFGKCHPTDCNWGTEALHLYGSSISDQNYQFGTAVYNKEHAVTLLTMELQDDGRLALEVFTQFKSGNRNNYHTHDHFQKRPGRGETPPKEDCIKFDPTKASVKRVGGRWKITVGNMFLKDFGNNEKEARQALRIIKRYGMNKQCFVGRPDPSLEYYLVNDKSPSGAFRGEDCLAFNPAKIEVKKISGSWKIVEGTHWILDFGDKEQEARASFRIIKKYGFRFICFVGRPNASMTYFRR